MHERILTLLLFFLLSATILSACDRHSGTVTILTPIKKPVLSKSLGDRNPKLPEQIVDRQLLADYQANFPTDASLLRQPPSHKGNTVEQIADRAALAAYQATILNP